MSRAVRVVLDTNVVLSALVSGVHDVLPVAAEFERTCLCPIMGLDGFCTNHCVQGERR